jgi:tRNA nucleotidyltransferase (CCA-adding enzyme)
MSDYMFMLESHLSSDQSRVVAEAQAVAVQANVSIFLTGGAMRDTLGGFPIHEIDFTVEGNASKLAKAIAQKAGAEILRTDENRKIVYLLFPGGVHASIGMARQEKYPKPGAKPQVQPATIHEDLRCRDFTINSIALSLNPASRGLLLDPNNGMGDLEHKELRAVGNYSLFDDPVRLLRLLRFKVRLGFAVSERTQSQYENAREAKLETRIPAPALLEELRHIAQEPNAADLVKALEDEKLLPLFSPALTGAKVNLPGLQKLQKARQMAPFGADLQRENLGLFLHMLTEKLTPKEKAGLVAATGLEKADIEAWQKIEARSKKLEKELKSARLSKASQLYALLSKAPGDQVLFLLLRSPERIVQDRIKNYFQKYLPAAQEITDKDVLAAGAEPGTPKYQKTREDLIATRLDARPKKPVPEPEVVPGQPGQPPQPGQPGQPGRPPHPQHQPQQQPQTSAAGAARK